MRDKAHTTASHVHTTMSRLSQARDCIDFEDLFVRSCEVKGKIR